MNEKKKPAEIAWADDDGCMLRVRAPYDVPPTRSAAYVRTSVPGVFLTAAQCREVAAHLRHMRGLRVDPRRIVVTAGARDGLALVLRTLGTALRVSVEGGGCSGFQYGFTFDEAVNDDDTQMAKNGVTLLIDAMSLQYLVGGSVDYTEGLEGSRFTVTNPNATTTCGCGSSFSI